MEDVYDLLIVAFPTTAFSFIVTEGEDAERVSERLGFYSDTLNRVSEIQKAYNIGSYSIYGPQTYIEGLKKLIENYFDVEVKTIPAGKD